MRFQLAAACAVACLPAAAWARDAADETGDAFELGQIVVRADAIEQPLIGGETLGQDAMETFDRNTLDDAADLIPGVSSGNFGGRRNERTIFVRGFDRWHVPVSIDGIRVYLPADNRLDYGRFLTPDLAEIQVAKGYASVLDGPGAMGGAVNLVTRTPTEPIEAEARGSLRLDGDADHAGYNTFALLGTRRGNWYAQASYARDFRDHWTLPDSFAPTASEDGGERELSRTEDWRVNAKIGFTPNATDEYTISYTRQEGSKNAPLSTADSIASQRYWSWPYWDIESVYFLSRTALTSSATLRLRAYRNTFDNLLRSFDDAGQTAQTRRYAFNSYYDDVAWGGSAQLDLALPANALSFALHYRRDKHVEYQQAFPSGETEPRQTNLEDTWSVAVEDTVTLSPNVRATLGASYDWRDLKRAEEYGEPPEGGNDTVFSYPLRDADAWNAQGRVEWDLATDRQLYASVSSRVRFPTIFERFSSRFGGATSNPGLAAERATNFEIGGSGRFGAVQAHGAVFYSRLDDAIVSIPFIFNGEEVDRNRNLASGDYYGAEIALDARVGERLSLGANYTWMHRDLEDPSNAAFRPTGVPTHKAFLYAEWRPVERLRVVPSLDVASDRWTVDSAGTLYYRTGAYVRADLRVDYDVTDSVTLGAGVRNAFDDLYVLTDGFPEPGRRFYVTARFGI